ncbi:MAG: hypothetical protein ThorAB25_09450 [Candidatus Thorarchaeota archaeon AB_25]|nr:MAG: hypothetical protein ThorAB25_09450 [Candidatus Thorarchaeota archaeon AB_25]
MMSLVNSSHAQSNSGAIIAAEGITLTVDFGNGTIKEYSNLNGSSVLEVTSSVLEVEIRWFGPFAYIKGIEGFLGEGEYGWQYWVNGEFASVAVSHYLLSDNDDVAWVYSTPTQRQQDPSLVPGIIIVSTAGFGFIAIVYIGTSRRIR